MAQKRKRLMIPLFASVAAMIGITIYTGSDETLAALAKLDGTYIAYLALLWMFIISADTVSIWFLVRGTGERVSVPFVFRVASVRIFFNMVTPFGFGGQPSTVYELRRKGVPAGKGTIVAVTRLLLLSLIVQIGAIASLVLFRDRFVGMPHVKATLLIAGAIGLLFIVLIVTGIRYPRVFIYITNGVGKLLSYVHLVKYGHRFKRAVVKEAFLARKSFQEYFTHRRTALAGAVLSCVAMYAAQLLLLFLILCALHLRIPVLDGLILSAVLLFFMLFLPTPGAAGLGEVAFAIIVGTMVPKYLLGVAVIIWRVFYQYITAAVGGVFVLRIFSGRVTRAVRR